MLRLENVCKTYKIKHGKVEALKNINLTLPSKGLIFITGESGSGKTTLLNCLSTISKVDSGNIIYNNYDLTKLTNDEENSFRKNEIALVFQEYNLISNFNVLENIIFPLKLSKEKIDENKLEYILDKLRISNLKERRITELSGGQKQRVSIARTLMKKSNILLADEPSGALDNLNSHELFSLLKEISKEKLVIVVTHDLEKAKEFGDGIVEISNGNIISNTVPQELEYENVELINQSSDFKSLVRIGWIFLFKRKKSLILSTIMIIFSMILFSFSYSVLSFDRLETTMKAFHDEHYSFVRINYFDGYIDEDNENLNYDNYKYLSEKYDAVKDSIYYLNNYHSNIYGVPYNEKSKRIFKTETICGTIPNKGECMISTYDIPFFYQWLKENRPEINVKENDYSEYLNLDYFGFKIVGVFKLNSYEELLKNPKMDLALPNIVFINESDTNIYNNYYYSRHIKLSNGKTIDLEKSDKNKKICVDVFDDGDEAYINLFSLFELHNKKFYDIYRDFIDKLEKQYEDLEYNEIKVMAQKATLDYGKQLIIDDRTITINNKEVKLKGYINPINTEEGNYVNNKEVIYASENIIHEIFPNEPIGGYFYASTDYSNKELFKLSIDKKYGLYNEVYEIMKGAVEAYDTVEFLAKIFILACPIIIILCILLILKTINDITHNVIKTIGVLKTMGVNTKDNIIIYSVIVLFLAIISLIFAFPFSITLIKNAAQIISASTPDGRYIYIKTIYFSCLNGILLFLLAFVIPILGSVWPIAKISKTDCDKIIKFE